MTKTKMLGAKIPEELNERLSVFARAVGKSKTDVVLMALGNYFDKIDTILDRALKIAGVDRGDERFIEFYTDEILFLENSVKQGKTDRKVADDMLKSWGAEYLRKSRMEI